MEKNMSEKSIQQYIVAGCKPWNRSIFNEIISSYPGEWKYVSSPGQLANTLSIWKPIYIFFLHWSWIVPVEIINNYECVCFHMTDVPYGRGGSPLQNLIARGHRKTKLTALQMVEELDAGPVYKKCDLSLEGNAEEIYIRAGTLSAEMIHYIIHNQPTPVPQNGNATAFKRRSPKQSAIPKLNSLSKLYDFIRMLDAEGYPHSYFEYKGFRYEFRRAAFYDGMIKADVTISPIEKEKNE
jgi:methionyl-tRNA formyltransferase